MNRNKSDIQTDTDVAVKKPNTGSSRTGAVLSLLALAVSAAGWALINSKMKREEVATTAGERAGEAIASGTWSVFSALLGTPFLIMGIGAAIFAIIFTVIHLRKVKFTGLIFSLIWLAISVWAIRIAVSAFEVIKAKS